MTRKERQRNNVLYEIRVQEFTNAMNTHQLRGRDAYELTELFIMWHDIGIDADYQWRLN